MFIPKKVFILKNGKQTEISLEEFEYLKKNDDDFKKKKFVGAQGIIFEADPKKYKEFYSAKRRNRYINEVKAELDIAVYSIDALVTREGSEIEISDTLSENIEDLFERNELRSIVKKCVSRLGEKERVVIIGLFYEKLSETALADRLGIAQTTVSYRKQQGLSKIKIMLQKQGIE